MTIWEMLAIALALAIDAFTVGAAVGLVHHEPRRIFRLSLHFGLFQALLPLSGALFGAVRGKREEPRGDQTRGLSLVGLCVRILPGQIL